MKRILLVGVFSLVLPMGAGNMGGPANFLSWLEDLVGWTAQPTTPRMEREASQGKPVGGDVQPTTNDKGWIDPNG